MILAADRLAGSKILEVGSNHNSEAEGNNTVAEVDSTVDPSNDPCPLTDVDGFFQKTSPFRFLQSGKK